MPHSRDQAELESSPLKAGQLHQTVFYRYPLKFHAETTQSKGILFEMYISGTVGIW